jgi:hypothetical protein
MKHYLAASLLALTFPLQAQNNVSPSAQPDPDDIVLVSPKESASDIKPHVINGGSRGASADDPMIAVLTPNQTALTIQAKPTLYWFQDKASKAASEVTLVQPREPKPLLLLTTKAPSTAGVHAFALSKFDAELKVGVVYSWSVAVVVNPASRSEDVVANGVIKRIEETPELKAELDKAADRDKPKIYARNGLFYDALQSLSDQIAAAPQDEGLRTQRSRLLAQIGLKQVKFADAAK